MRESLRQWILWQGFLTAFFVIILGVLRGYSKRAFFSYWMKGWAVFGAWLGACWLSLDAGLPPAWKWSLVFVSLSLSYLEVCLLYLGAFSLYPGRALSARMQRGWAAALLGFAAVLFVVVFALRAYPAASFALRSVPRSAALAAVYFYSALALGRAPEFAGSRGARLTRWGCLAYGVTKVIEAVETFAVGVLGTVSTAFQVLFELDAACELAVVAGMVLLLFEESRQFHKRLEIYESIVPTCSGCGAVRDDAGHTAGEGEWMPLHDFVERYSAARFSHGYCPRCLEVQLARARDTRSKSAARTSHEDCIARPRPYTWSVPESLRGASHPMSRMIDLIRQSAAPANVMRAASKGALSLPPGEMIEILVYLTTNPIFAEQAKMTLAGWDEASSITACKDPNTPLEVLQYFVAPANRRPRLIPALLENPSVPETALLDMAQAASRELVDMMLASARVRKSSHLLHALGTNVHLTPEESEQLKAALLALGEQTAKLPAYEEVGEEGKTQYELEHAAEIAAEEGKAFELVGGTLDDEETRAAAAALQIAPEAAATAAPASEEERLQKMRQTDADFRERLSPLQKIAKLTVGQRVQLAMRGNKEERFILIRDGSRVVSSAVLQSPKLSDAEVETFAGMKNVQESVLRDIARTKKFMKNYAVIRTLVSNPRCPLDLSLGLMNHLLVNDLKALSMNKNIADTLRKLAMKRYKEKSAPPGARKE